MFANDRIGDLSDHHAFRVRGKPYLFFSCGRWEHYHQPTDTFDRLNLTKMQGFANYLTELVRVLDQSVVQPSTVRDFWRVEAESVHRLVGLSRPESEAVVEQLITTMISRFALL